MKKSIILVVNLLIILSVFSQTSSEKTTRKGKPKKQYYEVAFGLSFPNINYKNTIYNHGFGQAKMGPNLALEASTIINNCWGYKYDLNVILYPGDEKKLFNEYSEVDAGNWINLNFGMGAFYNLNWGNTTLNFGMNGGFTSMSGPLVRYFNKDVLIKSNSGFGLGFNIKPNISAYYKLNDKIALKVFINYIFSPVIFESKSSSKSTNWIVNDYKETLFISSLNCGIGVRF